MFLRRLGDMTRQFYEMFEIAFITTELGTIYLFDVTWTHHATVV